MLDHAPTNTHQCTFCLLCAVKMPLLYNNNNNSTTRNMGILIDFDLSVSQSGRPFFFYIGVLCLNLLYRMLNECNYVFIGMTRQIHKNQLNIVSQMINFVYRLLTVVYC